MRDLICDVINYCVCIKLDLSDERTNDRPSIRPFVRLSLCPLCLSGASIPSGNEPKFIEI